MNNHNLLLLRLLVRDLWINGPHWRQQYRKALARWRNGMLTDLSKLLLLVLCVGLGYVVLLYYLQSLWMVFADTPSGNIFATRVSPEMEGSITAILGLDLVQIACDSLRNTLLVTGLLGILLKFTGLYRLLYQNRGFVGGAFWGSICIWIGATLLPIVAWPDAFRENAALYLLPTFALLAGTFSVAARLIPEFTVVFEFFELIRKRLAIIKIRDLPYEHPER